MTMTELDVAADLLEESGFDELAQAFRERTVWVVRGEQGSYSDWECWDVAVFFTEEDAKQFKEKLKTTLEEGVEAHKKNNPDELYYSVFYWHDLEECPDLVEWAVMDEECTSFTPYEFPEYKVHQHKLGELT